MRELSSTAPGCPGFQLRRLHAGELGRAEADAVRAHAGACDRCAATLAALDAERAAFRARLPEAAFLDAAIARAPRIRAEGTPSVARAPRLGRALAWAAPLAVAASVAIFVFLPPAPPTERIKGGGAVNLYVGGSTAARAAADGEQLVAGERLRVGVVPGERRYVLALSVDEAGEVSTLYDAQGTSVALEPGRENVLPDSIVFEGAGAERVYVLVTDEPLFTRDAARAVEAELRRAGSVQRMQKLRGLGGDQVTRLLRKPTP